MATVEEFVVGGGVAGLAVAGADRGPEVHPGVDVVGGVAELLDVVVEAEVVEFVSAGGDEVEGRRPGLAAIRPATSSQTAMPPPRSAAQVYQPDFGRHQDDGRGVGIRAGDGSNHVVGGASTRPPSTIMVISEPTASNSGPASDGRDLEDGQLDRVEGPLGVAQDGMAVGVAHDEDDAIGAVLAGQLERGVDAGGHALLIVGFELPDDDAGAVVGAQRRR